jgi:hypothetical protein
MPIPPRPDNGGVLDPRRHGDGHAYNPPNRRWDGNAVTQRPWQNQYGRNIPPGRDHITIINNTTIINNMNGIHRGWNSNDHGYGWYEWNGYRTCHHYDSFGYHWWGFYIGDAYFWTRYANDRYWWYDPYYNRWVYLHDGRWWWQDPVTPTVVYVIIDNNYYRYQDNGGTIITRPDQTQPVVTPPAEPNVPSTPAPDQDTMYSLDGTRSVQILGAAKEAYLYDLTATDSNGAAAGGRWLASGVKSAKFVYDDKHESDGSTTQVIRQIELDYDDALIAAVADPNGERKIMITGTERSADLYNLDDENVAPAYLASGVSEIKLVNGETMDSAGAVTRELKLVIVTAKDDAGVDALMMFNRDGGPYEAAAPEPAPSPASVSPVERMKKSAAFNELLSGQLGW